MSRWHVGLSVDELVWNHSTFSKNRDRPFGANIARELFESVIRQAHATGLLSEEHFSVAETSIQPWTSNHIYRPKDGSDDALKCDGRNRSHAFHGGPCSNETHASTTDPEAEHYRILADATTNMCYIGHMASKSCHGLVVEAQGSEANGTSERISALEMNEKSADVALCTGAADMAYSTRSFVKVLRQISPALHVAQNNERNGGSAFGGRTTCRSADALSSRASKLIEEAIGWGKAVGFPRRPNFRVRRRIENAAVVTFTGNELVRTRNLLARGFW